MRYQMCQTELEINVYKIKQSTVIYEEYIVFEQCGKNVLVS